ncbi:MAG: sulfatase activating formylglycine-generating enzyme [Paracoccaceae bacterium]|jgi:formylglycine-generating enzyme required for sulfatase activity
MRWACTLTLAAVAPAAVTLASQLVACAAIGGRTDAPPSPMTVEWYEVVSQQPGPEVTDMAMRQKIDESGQPWKVRDRTTGIELILVLPGDFLMGSRESEAGRQQSEGQPHLVRLTKPFYLGATEVTQAQWQRLMGPTPSFFEGQDKPIDASWNDLQVFLTKASEGATANAERLRLPTEAEWEYACRAGTTGEFSFEGPIQHALVNFNDGDVKNAVVVAGRLEVEWNTPPAPECRMTTAPAGSLPPNPWGLHEMHGNLWEWTDDRYSPEGYVDREAVAVDPFDRAVDDELRTLRGGSWYDNAHLCRSTARDAGGPVVRSNRIGFRVARSL